MRNRKRSRRNNIGCKASTFETILPSSRLEQSGHGTRVV